MDLIRSYKPMSVHSCYVDVSVVPLYRFRPTARVAVPHILCCLQRSHCYGLAKQTGQSALLASLVSQTEKPAITMATY